MEFQLQHQSFQLIFRTDFLRQLDGETMETVPDLILGARKSLQVVTAAMKLKESCSFEEKLWPIYIAF